MEVFISGVKHELENKGISTAAAKIKQYLERPRNIPLHIAITGESDSGKSTFINSFRGIGDKDDKAAPTDVVESSKDPIPYFHPEYPNVILWDLPGIGTMKYPANSYCLFVPLWKYDFFIIMSADRLTENEVKLAQEIQRMKKKFYFVHSKTDNDIRAERRKRDFSTKRSLTKIRENCVQGLQRQGFKSPQVFLVSSFNPHLYDFSLLKQTLDRELCAQRDALLFVMPNINLEIISKKKKVFQSKVKYYATLSAAVAAVPVPGLSAAVDIGLMVKVVKDYVADFSLDKSSLESLAVTTGVSFTNLNDVIRSPLAGAEITARLLLKVLTQLAYTAAFMEAEEGVRWIPVIGLVASACLSFTLTYKALNYFLDTLADDAQRVFKKALGLN